jgi:WD40 repeat protein
MEDLEHAEPLHRLDYDDKGSRHVYVDRLVAYQPLSAEHPRLIVASTVRKKLDVRVFCTHSGTLLGVLQAPVMPMPSWIRDVQHCYLGDGSSRIAFSSKNTLTIADGDSLAVLFTYTNVYPSSLVALHPFSGVEGVTLMAAGSETGQLFVFDVDHLGLLHSSRFRGSIISAITSFVTDAGAERLVAGDGYGNVKVWDHRGAVVRQLVEAPGEEEGPNTRIMRLLAYHPSAEPSQVGQMSAPSIILDHGRADVTFPCRRGSCAWLARGP